MCENQDEKIRELLKQKGLEINSRIANKPNYPKPEKKIITAKTIEKSKETNDSD